MSSRHSDGHSNLCSEDCDSPDEQQPESLQGGVGQIKIVAHAVVQLFRMVDNKASAALTISYGLVTCSS